MINDITVAIPTYNGEKYIKDAIRSILEQTIKVDKILVIDDFSSDNTLVIVKELMLNVSNLRIIGSNVNLGYQKNWNRCFENCSTKYLIILHQDDILKNNCVEKQINIFNEDKNIALVGGQEDSIDEKGNTILEKNPIKTKIFQKGEILEFVTETGSYIPCSSVMFNLEKIRDVGFFDERYLATDELFWPKVLDKYPIAILGESLIDRRSHSGQTEYSDFILKYNEINIAVEQQFRIALYEENISRRKRILNLLKKKATRNYIRISFYVIKTNFNIGIKYLYKAFKTYPQIFFSKFFIKYTAKLFLGKTH